MYKGYMYLVISILSRPTFDRAVVGAKVTKHMKIIKIGNLTNGYTTLGPSI